MKNTLTLRLSTALAALAGTTLSAQTTPPAPAAVTQEEAIVLSPFTVNTSLDEGYAATQTMSGTRLATNLRDVASVVSPMTIDFLKDIDATNLQQAILFTPGTDEDPRPYNSQNNNPVFRNPLMLESSALVPPWRCFKIRRITAVRLVKTPTEALARKVSRSDPGQK